MRAKAARLVAKPIDAAGRSGGVVSDGMATRIHQATGETLLVPARKGGSWVGRITGNTGKSADDERVADGSVVAGRRSNVRGAKGPCCFAMSSVNMGGRGEMIKAPIDLQDLRRRIYVKAKAEPAWRFWGLYVHVCKRETLHEAYLLAKKNNGAPGIDGVTFEAIEAKRRGEFPRADTGRTGPAHTYRPMRNTAERDTQRRGQRSASWAYPPSATAWSRELSSSSWNRSSRLTSNRGRLATGRSGQLMKRCNGSPRPSSSARHASSTSICGPTSTTCGTSCCWRRWRVG